MAETGTDPEARPPRIGLVLGGGGVTGYGFHAGALAALEAATGWDPRDAEVIVGTSAGSSVAALLRGGVTVTALVERIMALPGDPEAMARLRQVVRGNRVAMAPPGSTPAPIGRVLAELRRRSQERIRRAAGTGRTRPGPGRPVAAARPDVDRIPPGALSEAAGLLHGDTWPEATLWIAAVDARTGRRAVFGRDPIEVPVATAVQASCAVPGLFEPVEINGRRYVDGGVRSALNSDVLARVPLDLAVVLSPLSVNRAQPSPSTTLVRAFPALQARTEMGRLRRRGVDTLLLQPDGTIAQAMGLNPMAPDRLLAALETTVATHTGRFEAVPDRRQLRTLRSAR
ncbi:MAG: patatin-like phospholipase family protein [Acidimicrobiales bacterium]